MGGRDWQERLFLPSAGSSASLVTRKNDVLGRVLPSQSDGKRSSGTQQLERAVGKFNTQCDSRQSLNIFLSVCVVFTFSANHVGEGQALREV